MNAGCLLRAVCIFQIGDGETPRRAGRQWSDEKVSAKRRAFAPLKNVAVLSSRAVNGPLTKCRRFLEGHLAEIFFI